MLIYALTAALFMAPDAPAAPDPASDLATLQQLYDSSCGSRGYGAYDDVCDQISTQMREARRALARRPAPAAPPPRPSLPASPPINAAATTPASAAGPPPPSPPP